MSKFWLLSLLALGACGSTPEQKVEEAQEALQVAAEERDLNRIQQELVTRGFAQVGTTPSGKPLYMMYVRSSSYISDRVYFSDGSITAREWCGKNCTVSVTTEGN